MHCRERHFEKRSRGNAGSRQEYPQAIEPQTNTGSMSPNGRTKWESQRAQPQAAQSPVVLPYVPDGHALQLDAPAEQALGCCVTAAVGHRRGYLNSIPLLEGSPEEGSNTQSIPNTVDRFFSFACRLSF